MNTRGSFHILNKQFANPCGVSSPKLMGLKIEIPVSTFLTGICFEGCPDGLLTKKDIALRRCLLVGVPGRTRTVDIQNHNLTL